VIDETTGAASSAHRLAHRILYRPPLHFAAVELWYLLERRCRFHASERRDSPTAAPIVVVSRH